ncbi:RsmB/NOP family class I SAM-dependent RNA methyltransferase [Aeromonas rivuli]|jgi:16S rRNA (cytosine967-C5)-methyltransferase|uniref:RsmB/NOP family class I SAM-dependent RNA methyltransferase n=1 Tax=Aeromonas TaxID=642 RepID=UPI0005A6ACF7|nr:MULTISPECIES: RsmB/NOP family class I SAM-dependent RNA methyltransferase [Aeromonas]MCS3455367.1 16S rRNA (cytosine967-C5)-methyltransferase [Aeromonas sp. BIGb0405]MCS3458344.1 16S rRNA (cytosine967-C5)-methyltransferase [Aeromonas sp. BIGb0445]UBO72901.1 RsmB/NOP family class I SAM-dependent RNA methyltransferase [Aeromonas rivuli]
MLKSPLLPRFGDLVDAILDDVLTQGLTLDRAYARHFSGIELKPQEQARIALVTGDLLRRLSLYCNLSGIQVRQAAKNVWPLLHSWHAFHKIDMPNHPSLDRFNEEAFRRRLTEAKKNPVLMDGCPSWLEKLGAEQLGDAWPAERAALAWMPKRYLRVNSLKCTKAQLQAQLNKEHVSTIPVEGVDSALQVTSDSALFRTKAFADGWFEQQDAGSQLVAAALDVKPGMKVIDACAGAGGKTLHISALMEGKGRLLAMDVEEWKLENLKQRARRAGAHNVETRVITSSKTVKRLKESADRVLLDVPCSGLGVLKRNPDAKWRDTAERLPILMALQEEILQRYSQMTKIGGILVYATCSILPSENRQQIDKFLAANEHFRLLDDHNVSPSQTGFDGFYMARLERIS